MADIYSGDKGRRRFIKTVVLSTGAVFLDWNVRAEADPSRPKALTGALDYKTAHKYLRDTTGKFAAKGGAREAADVIVIGGGLSGLAAAWTVIKSGKTALIIDNEPVPGGAVRSGLLGSGNVEIGAHRFVQPAGAFASVIADCGLTAVRIPADGYWIDNSTILYDLYSEKTLRESTVAVGTPIAMRNFRNYTLALDPKPTFPLSDASESVIAEFDLMEGTEIISHFPGAELADWLDVYSMGVLGRTLSKANAYAFYATYCAQFGEMFDNGWYTFNEGMSALPAALAKKIGPKHIQSGALAVRVENVKGGVEVDVVSPEGMETLRAKSAIVAIQKRVAQRLVTNLPGVQQYRMKAIPLAPAITVQVRCSERLFASRAYALWIRDAGRRITHILDCSYMEDRAHDKLDRTDGEFLYTIPCIPPDTSMRSLEDEQWLVQYAQLIVDAIADFAPSIFKIATEVRVFAWGHSIVSPLPGMIGQLYPHTAEPFEQISFAGSDIDICSTVQGAVGNGVRAATEVLASK